jgi:hypothetical protein
LPLRYVVIRFISVVALGNKDVLQWKRTCHSEVMN